MLKFFSRLERTRNFLLLIFAVLMVASLVFFYSPARNIVQANLAGSSETAAKVSGEKITVGELFRQKERYSQFSRGQSFPAKMMLNGLISSRLARVEAERLGLTATDAEVAAEIRKQFTPTDGQPFDQKRYEENMAEQFGSVRAFEENVRDDLSAKRLQAFLTAGVTVSEDEVLRDFQRKNTKFDLSYVSVNTTDLAQAIQPTDQELRDYFEKNKASYYISVPQKKVRYVFIDTEKIGQKLQITDADLRAEYDKLPADKKTAGASGQEIVLRVPKPDMEQQVLEKANGLIQELKAAGPTVTQEAFATAAHGHSENPASAAKGGALPGPIRENTNNPTDPYQRLLKMKPGEISEPISYQGRYFILRRGEDVPKTFEDARKELDVSLRNRKAFAVAAELAQKAAESLKQTHDAAKTAAEFAGQANSSVAQMVRETPYIKPGDNIDKIGTSPDFEAAIAPLENASDVGDKVPIQNGFAIPMLVDKKEPRDADFDEVKAQIVEVVKLDKARAQVEQTAKAIADGATSASTLAAAAQAQSMKVQDQKSFVLGSPLGQGPSATTSEALENAIFDMKEGEVTKAPINVGENWYIVAVNHREEAKMDEYTKQRDQLIAAMQQQKRDAVYSDYLASTRAKYEKEGRITIYPDALAKLDAPEPGAPGSEAPPEGEEPQ